MENLSTFCDICEKTVPNLMMHMINVHKRGSLDCPFCGQKMASYSSQYAHILSFHAVETGNVIMSPKTISDKLMSLRGSEILELVNHHVILTDQPQSQSPYKKRMLNQDVDVICQNNFTVIYHEGWLMPLVGCHTKTHDDLKIICNPSHKEQVFANDLSVPLAQITTAQWLTLPKGVVKFHMTSAHMNRLSISDYLDTFKSFNIILTVNTVNVGFMSQIDNHVTRLLEREKWDRIDVFVGAIPKMSRGIQVNIGQFVKEPSHIWVLLLLKRKDRETRIQPFICPNEHELNSIWCRRAKLEEIEELAGQCIFSDITKTLKCTWDESYDVFRCKRIHCFLTFATLQMLAEHKSNDHSPFDCSHCEKTFPDESSLAEHTNTYHCKHECHICGNKFHSAQSLKIHIQRHADMREYKCGFENCGKDFKTIGDLKLHEKRHQDRKRLPCPYCHKTLAQSGSLRKHIRSIHPTMFKKWSSSNKLENARKAAIPKSSSSKENVQTQQPATTATSEPLQSTFKTLLTYPLTYSNTAVTNTTPSTSIDSSSTTVLTTSRSPMKRVAQRRMVQLRFNQMAKPLKSLTSQMKSNTSTPSVSSKKSTKSEKGRQLTLMQFLSKDESS